MTYQTCSFAVSSEGAAIFVLTWTCTTHRNIQCVKNTWYRYVAVRGDSSLTGYRSAGFANSRWRPREAGAAAAGGDIAVSHIADMGATNCKE